MSAEHGPTAGEYIVHHLTHLQNKEMSGIIDFSVYNLDSIFWSILLGVVGCFFLWRAAKSATAGAPGRFQAAVEILVEMVDTQAKGIIHNAESQVGRPLGVDRVRLDLPDERHGLVAGRSAAHHLASHLRRGGPRSASCVHARGALCRFVDHAWFVELGAVGLYLLQPQNQRGGGLGA